jgi:hypothetical protein
MAVLRTEKCIVTGEKATVFCGHVIIRSLFNLTFDKHVDSSVLAGFKDQETFEKTSWVKTPGEESGYLGEWKPEYGIQVELSNTDKERMGIKES